VGSRRGSRVLACGGIALAAGLVALQLWLAVRIAPWEREQRLASARLDLAHAARRLARELRALDALAEELTAGRNAKAHTAGDAATWTARLQRGEPALTAAIALERGVEFYAHGGEEALAALRRGAAESGPSRARVAREGGRSLTYRSEARGDLVWHWSLVLDGLVPEEAGGWMSLSDGRGAWADLRGGERKFAGTCLRERVPHDGAELEIAVTTGVDTGLPLPAELLSWVGLGLVAVSISALYLTLRALRAEHEASHRDPLTGLHNRRLFHELLSEEIAQAERYGRELSLGIVDLDGFKLINDTLGHRAGDRVLQGTAAVLSAGVRKSDRVFRYGGEEFAILMPETGELAAAAALERVRRALAEQAIPYGRGEAQVRCSIGVTAYQPGESEEELVVRADRACYAAKRRGRDQVVLERVVDGASRELSLAEIDPRVSSAADAAAEGPLAAAPAAAADGAGTFVPTLHTGGRA
jgi:diguanylate cyclase (GGDEF)-like protein